MRAVVVHTGHTLLRVRHLRLTFDAKGYWSLADFPSAELAMFRSKGFVSTSLAGGKRH